ncbi:S41 family peptidase [Gemmatimonadota bacterium]
MRDPGAGGYRIDYIYQHDPDYPDEMSPLADPDLNISEGDVILAVNGQATLSVPDMGALLRNQSRQVRLSVRPAAGGQPRDLMVTPTSGESNLRYSDWEYTRRMEVEEAGGGQIGYLHLRAMGGGNITEFYRNFYPVFDRQGLIIDVRRNSGGNIDSFILEKLMREAWMYWKDRAGNPTWNMHYAFRGHMVVLVDQNTASDGEAFADGFMHPRVVEVVPLQAPGVDEDLPPVLPDVHGEAPSREVHPVVVQSADAGGTGVHHVDVGPLPQKELLPVGGHLVGPCPFGHCHHLGVVLVSYGQGHKASPSSEPAARGPVREEEGAAVHGEIPVIARRNRHLFHPRHEPG